jgi:ATP-binding cassette subfamily F protein 3
MPSNLLLLDEPTNHLDIPAREAIEEFMTSTPATLMVVSHDRRLLETVCQRLWVVDDGLAVPFDGGYRQWRAAVGEGWTVQGAAEQEARRLRTAKAASGGRGAPAGGGASSADASPSRHASRASGRATATGAAGTTATLAALAPAKRQGPVRREKLSKEAYKRQKAAAEAELTRLGLRKNHLELALGDPNVQSNFVELRRMTSELADVELALATAEETWLEIEVRAP